MLSADGREINHDYNSAFLVPLGTFMSLDLVAVCGVLPCVTKLLVGVFGSKM